MVNMIFWSTILCSLRVMAVFNDVREWWSIVHLRGVDDNELFNSECRDNMGKTIGSAG